MDITITIPDDLAAELQDAAQEVKQMTPKGAVRDFLKFILREHRTRQKISEVVEPDLEVS